MKTTIITKRHLLTLFLLLTLGSNLGAQVNSGSDGRDGAFNPTTNMVVDMHDHPNGIYQYTSVSIPHGVDVTFIPNANNTPVVWLVQSNCSIVGNIYLNGQDGNNGGGGGPGGFSGGNGGTTAGNGQGPGGGLVGFGSYGGAASYGELGDGGCSSPYHGPIYGNQYILPLIGGSGGGGTINFPAGGGGGGGAILIATTQGFDLNGNIEAIGKSGAYVQNYSVPFGGPGSGGSVRIVSPILSGTGTINVIGGYQCGGGQGRGRVRFDVLVNKFGGSVNGIFTQGFQPVIIPAAGQGVQLTIATIGGIAVAVNPSGMLVTPDAVIAGQQTNPIPIVVNCSNLPLNTPITVTVKPANGSLVSAIGSNNTGTLASSTATISLNMPRGGGIIYATAATGN